MRALVRVAACVVIAAGITAGPAFADTHDGDQVKFVKGKFDTPVSRVEVESDWAARGCRVNRYDAEPGWAKEEHFHELDTLLTVAEGRLEMVVEGQRFVLEPGDEIFSPRQTAHSLKNLDDGFTVLFHGYVGAKAGGTPSP